LVLLKITGRDRTWGEVHKQIFGNNLSSVVFRQGQAVHEARLENDPGRAGVRERRAGDVSAGNFWAPVTGDWRKGFRSFRKRYANQRVGCTPKMRQQNACGDPLARGDTPLCPSFCRLTQGVHSRGNFRNFRKRYANRRVRVSPWGRFAQGHPWLYRTSSDAACGQCMAVDIPAT